MDRHVRILVARLCYGEWEHAALGDWIAETSIYLSNHSQVENWKTRRDRELASRWLNESPVYRARNLAEDAAEQCEADYLVMVDQDQLPDCDPTAPRFIEEALTFALAQDGPCVLTAPTMMASGQPNIYREVRDENAKHLIPMEREYAKNRTGIEIVKGSGLGLVLIDMRVFHRLSIPYFRFYYDRRATKLLGGEDIVFTADCGGPGIPIYACWDCWSGHSKRMTLGKP